MDSKNLFIFKCDTCEETFTKKYSLQRHIQTMHDHHKFTCDICYTQFSRLYIMNNHKKMGKCKLNIGNNPIVSVTPLGMVNSLPPNGENKVSGWLQTETNQPQQTGDRMDTEENLPSTSTGIRSARPTITLPQRKMARAQIRAMSTTAVRPNDEQWKKRIKFNPGLPQFHEDQQLKDFGNTAPRVIPPPTLFLP